MSGSTVWIPVLASMKGFMSEVQQGADKAASAAGSSLKKGLGDAGKQGGESASAQIAKAVEAQTVKIVSARKSEAKAAAEVSTTEQKLKTLRESGTATASQISRAEQQAETAKGNHAVASERLTRTERDRQTVMDGGRATLASLAQAEDQLASAKVQHKTDTDRLRTAELAHQETQDKSAGAANKVKAAEDNLQAVRAQYGENSKQAEAAERQLETAKKQATTASNQVVTAESNVTKARAELASATDVLEAKTLSHNAAQEKAAQAENKSGSEAQKAGQQIRGMGDDMSGAESKSSSLTSSLMGAAGKAGGLAIAFTGVAGVTGTLKAGFDKLTSIEDTTASLEVITGSAATAETAIDSLRKTNEGTPYTFDSWAEAGKNLIAFGVDAEYASDVVEALGEAASASGKGESALNQMADALGKASAKGKLGLEALNSLSQGGVEGMKILANEAGVTTEEMSKMISKGAVPADKAIKTLTDGIKNGSDGAAGSTRALSGVMEKLGGNTSGTIARMKSSFTNLGADVMEMFVPVIATVAEFLMDWAKKLREVISIMKEHKGIIVALTGVIGAFAAGLAAVKIAAFASQMMLAVRGYIAMYRAVGLAKGAMILFNASVWANPLVWVVAGIVAVVAGLALFFTKTEAGRAAWSAFTDFLGAAWEKIKGYFASAWDAIKPVWDGLIDGVKKVWDAIGPIFDRIREAWGNLVDWFRNADFEGALSFVRGAFDLAFTPARLAIEAVSNAWRIGAELFSSHYEEHIAPMLEAFQKKWQEAKDVIAPFIDSMKEKWEAFSTAVKEFYDAHLAPAFDSFREEFGKIIGKVKEFIQQWWEPYLKPALMVLVAILIGPVALALAAVVLAIGLVVGAIMGLIYVAISLPIWIGKAVEAVKQWFSDMWANVTQWFADMGESISGWWTEHVATLPDKVSGAVEDVKQWFSDLWSSVTEWFAEMGRSVSDWWNNHVAPLPGQVGSAVTGMLGKLGELPGKIGELFAKAGEWLVSAGSRIINGLWDGMKSAWENTKNWLSDKLSFNSIGSLVGLSAGGVVEMHSGGVMEHYISGGVSAIEQYANGGAKESHVAQIAPAGAWRVWAEDETGGEAYIPLASSKRGRSTAILEEVAGRFGYMLVDSSTGQAYDGSYTGDLGPQNVTAFAEGGVVNGDDLLKFVGGQGAARPLEGDNYVFGGSNWGDCSGAVSAVAARAVGENPFPRKFYTGDEAAWLTSRGFSRGRGGDGDLRIGFLNGGPAGGHTSGTLPDGTNFEMGGARGNGQVGGGAAGAWDSYYDTFFYLPMAPAFENVELGGLGELPSADAPAVPASTANTTDVQLSDTSAGMQDTSISGMAGSVASEMVSGHVADILGVFGVPDTLPSWVTGAQEVHSAATSPRTSMAEDHAIANHDAAVTSMTPTEMSADPQLSSLDSPDVIEMPKVPEWGVEFFAHEIARAAKAKGLGKQAAVIGTGTSLVESGDPLKMWANNAVPESLKYRHDAVGSDYDSVGLFQQRDNGAWGTVAQRMDPFDSAGMFFDELKKFDWESMDPGAAAQKVQRSAFPDRYAAKMTRAEKLVNATGLYDSGGVLDDEHLALNLSGKPEAVLTNDQWQMVDQLGANLPELVGSSVSSGVSGAAGLGVGALSGIANAVVPGSGAVVGAVGAPLAELGGKYVGEVAGGMTSTAVNAVEQAVDVVSAPIIDIAGTFSGASGPVVDGAQASIGDIPQRKHGADGDDYQGRGRAPVNIYVQNMDQAYEAKKHEEARALAGF